MKAKFVLLDLDNTISNDGWRLDRIEWGEPDMFKRYHNYHSLSSFDALANPHIVNVAGTTQFILTSRPKHYEAATREWLRRNGVEFSILMMRPEGNLQSSVELKSSFLTVALELFGVHGNDTIAYDDREDVIAMYRKNGLRAELVRAHDKPLRKAK